MAADVYRCQALLAHYADLALGLAGASVIARRRAPQSPAQSSPWTSNAIVSGVQYNFASQLPAIVYYGNNETRSYNNLLQLANITTQMGTLATNLTYNYASGSNNGKITSMTDGISGETVSYQYDSLNRLISAAGSGWTQTQSYDGFGNLIGRAGTGTAQSTTISTPADPTTNRLTGYSYDANGNQISTGYSYDAENRIASANAGAVEYFYDGQNKRVWQGNFSSGSLTSDVVTLFGADGKMVASYQPVTGGTTVTFYMQGQRSYFGGKLVGQRVSGTMQPAVQDRLGSAGKYYPYGEERNSPQLPNDTMKFATYTRDSATGNDYADQRYYTSALGRFMTPDRYESKSGAPADPLNPKTWNRYSYVVDDPINFNDPSGRFQCSPDNPNCVPDCDPFDPFCIPPGPFPVPPPLISTTVNCDVSVFAQTLPGTAGLIAHTYIETDVQVVVNGYVVSEISQIFEATSIPKSDPQSQCTRDMSLTGQCWLNNVSSGPFLTAPSGPPPKPNNPNNPSTQIWDSGFSSDNCSKVLSIQFFAGLYPDNTFTYAGLPVPYTSNSFVYTLLKVAGLPTDAVLNGALAHHIPLPLEGWGLTIPLFP